MTKIAAKQSVLDINFEAFNRAGIMHVVSDVESTLAPYGIAEVDPKILEYIDRNRDLGHIGTLSLFTNKTNVFVKI